MADSLLLGALGCAALAYALEFLLQPRPAGAWRRPGGCHLVHWGLCWLAFAGLALLLQRPYFALAVVGAFLFLVVMVNNAKFHSLREPFICQDFEYFTDALKHPRLYIPFLGWGRALAAALAAVAAIWAGFALETPLTADIGWPALLRQGGMLALAGVSLLALGTRICPPAEHVPLADLSRLGLLASLWRYHLDEAASPQIPDTPLPTLPPVTADSPDLVVVQSESFFDARRSYPGLRRDLLPEFDRLRRESAAWGQLEVPAWGANTVRSEFSVLSGLAAERLGVHRFNPYRRLAKCGVATLASCLRDAGYRTVCVHPYPATFYERHRVYPLLGFDRFIDISAFGNAERYGPYVSDGAVAAMVGDLLAEQRATSAQPLFVFVITMENHGPLHLEKVAPGDSERLYEQVPPAGCDDLTIYARHLVNADRMFGRLREMLLESPRPGTLCVYGDHVPIMPGVYSTMGIPDGTTDYFVWSKRLAGSQEAPPPRSAAMSANELAPMLLGLLSS